MGGFGEFGIILTPVRDHVTVAFGVKLKANGMAANAKPLVWAGRGRRQPVGAAWQVEGVAMPMEHHQSTR